MTPKEELVYHIINKYGPITQTQVMKRINGKINRNDYSHFVSLEKDGFIKKRCCNECSRDGLYETTKKKIRPSRIMS